MKHLNRKSLLFFMFALLFLLTAGKQDAEAASRRLSRQSVTIVQGKTTQITMKGVSAKKVKWYSSNKKIATVSKGKITAVKGGKTTVTARVGSRRYRCKVTVMSLNATKVTLAKGGTCVLKVKNGKNTKWESMDPSVVKVSQKGKVLAKKTGVTYVVCRSNGKKLKCKVYVASLNEDSLRLSVDSQFSLQTLNYGNKCTYSSSNTAVAAVNKTGVISALQPGVSTITCKTGKAVLTCDLKIISPDNITTPYAELPTSSRGDKLQVTVNGYPESRTYTIYKQSADANKTDGKGIVERSYLPNHGCAACALTTVFSGFKGMKSGPAFTIETLEPRVFGTTVWKANYTKASSKQMPVSLYGISKALSRYGIKNRYVKTIGAPEETSMAKANAQAVQEIEAHLKTGNPVVIVVANYNRTTKQKDTKWANSYHTMVLLGMTDTGKAIVADSADRSDAVFGDKKRVKYATVKSLVPYMFSCTVFTGKSVYWGGKSTSGGYLLVNPQD